MLKGPRRANCNAKAAGFDNASPLHFAVQNRHAACVSLLLAHGGRRNQQDDTGRTPYDNALEAHRLAKDGGEGWEMATWE